MTGTLTAVFPPVTAEPSPCFAAATCWRGCCSMTRGTASGESCRRTRGTPSSPDSSAPRMRSSGSGAAASASHETRTRQQQAGSCPVARSLFDHRHSLRSPAIPQPQRVHHHLHVRSLSPPFAPFTPHATPQPVIATRPGRLSSPVSPSSSDSSSGGEGTAQSRQDRTLLAARQLAQRPRTRPPPEGARAGPARPAARRRRRTAVGDTRPATTTRLTARRTTALTTQKARPPCWRRWRRNARATAAASPRRITTPTGTSFRLRGARGRA